ncbi:Phosphatidylinositide phosphatase SAC2 [Aphelenchoides fujianensis]|nr:Phosphatidylinositide phosphatase SAC2 [Aphelenchoides fujianensis]
MGDPRHPRLFRPTTSLVRDGLPTPPDAHLPKVYAAGGCPLLAARSGRGRARGQFRGIGAGSPRIFGHTLSYVQIRGSVPLFWSQRGYRYRPPLVIDKPLKRVPAGLRKARGHREGGLRSAALHREPRRSERTGVRIGRRLPAARAGKGRSGRELLRLRLPRSMPRAPLRPGVRSAGRPGRGPATNRWLCWIDKSGEMVREQRGIVRTNCVDCLDRTNVVQSAISQLVCAAQARKLGLIEPFEETPEVLVQILQQIWADHGDCISRQYAGTSALKGDITRGGRRRLRGFLKDGVNSATRYIVSHRAIEALTTGRGSTLIKARTEQEELEIAQEATSNSPSSSDDESEPEEEEVENIGRLVHETARFVLPADEVLVGGWALVDGANRSAQVDTVLLLTRTQILVASYADEETEKLSEVKAIPFTSIDRIEVGTLDKSPRQHLRIYWTQTTKTRLFNNVAIALKDATEADEYVLAIAEQLRITTSMCGWPVEVKRVEKLSGSSANKEAGRRSLVASLSAKLKLTTAQLRGDEPKTSGISHSRSEGLLANAAATSSGLLSSGLSKLQSRFKTPLVGKRLPASNSTLNVPLPPAPEPKEAEVAADPPPAPAGRFDAHREAIEKSKSRIMLL